MEDYFISFNCDFQAQNIPKDGFQSGNRRSLDFLNKKGLLPQKAQASLYQKTAKLF
jgi:hypothetical protein